MVLKRLTMYAQQRKLKEAARKRAAFLKKKTKLLKAAERQKAVDKEMYKGLSKSDIRKFKTMQQEQKEKQRRIREKYKKGTMSFLNAAYKAANKFIDDKPKRKRRRKRK